MMFKAYFFLGGSLKIWYEKGGIYKEITSYLYRFRIFRSNNSHCRYSDVYMTRQLHCSLHRVPPQKTALMLIIYYLLFEENISYPLTDIF